MKPADRVQTLNLLLQYLLQAKKSGASGLVFSAAGGNSWAASLSPEGAAVEPKQLSNAELEQLAALVSERACCWPEPGDNLFEVDQQEVRRLLFAPLSSFRLRADAPPAKRAAGDPFSLSNLVWTGIPPIVDQLVMRDYDRKAVIAAARNRSGIVVCNKSIDPCVPGSAALFLALRPDAVFYPESTQETLSSEILPLSASHLVVVQRPGTDPIEMLYSFLDDLVQNASLLPQCVQRLHLSFVQLRVKRTCGVCAKSTPVLPDTLERLPAVLRSKADPTYMFSRGCQRCGDSAYRGTVGLNSSVMTDDALRGLLLDRRPAQELADSAYQAGARSILEDGLGKIYLGLTSFEQVFSVATSLSPAFAYAAENSAARQAQAAAQASAAASRGGPRRNRRRLLIVEDEADQREVLQIVFQKEGYEVLLCADGKEALEELARTAVDIVVCDVMMPVMNGFELVRALRENPLYKRLPVLMLTAAGNPDDEVSLLSLGADDYCAKNVKRKILLQRVERLIEKRRSDNPVEHLLEDDEE